jgi:hypothetical protein
LLRPDAEIGAVLLREFSEVRNDVLDAGLVRDPVVTRIPPRGF